MTSIGHRTRKNSSGPNNRHRNQLNDDDEYFEPLSYKKLQKQILVHHPCDPDTKKKLSFRERITVKDYESKMMDVCFCYALT